MDMIEIPPDTFARFSRATRRSIQELVHQADGKPQLGSSGRFQLGQCHIQLYASRQRHWQGPTSHSQQSRPFSLPSAPSLRAPSGRDLALHARSNVGGDATECDATIHWVRENAARSMGATEVHLQGRGCPLHVKGGASRAICALSTSES
jgi:hypothetical protein